MRFKARKTDKPDKYWLNQLSFNVDLFPFKIQGFKCRFTMSKTHILTKH